LRPRAGRPQLKGDPFDSGIACERSPALVHNRGCLYSAVLPTCAFEEIAIVRAHKKMGFVSGDAVPLDIAGQVYESVRNAIIYYAGIHYEGSGHREWVHSVERRTHIAGRIRQGRRS
jgi:hypothetical protein